MSNNALFRLIELGRDWLIDLNNAGDEWTLLITSRRGPAHAAKYIGTDLERVINHAWAGAPEGRV